MLSYKAGLVSFVVVLFLFGCPEVPEPPRLPMRSSPIPEKISKAYKVEETRDSVAKSNEEELTDILAEPLVKRFSSPGLVRWRVKLNAAVTSLHWSPLAGLILTAGSRIHNVTSRGQKRWSYVAGNGSRVFAVNSSELVWSPAFKRLSGLIKGGRTSWSRDWDGRLESDGQGGIYLYDASTVSALGENGSDRWRVAFEGVRSLQGPFPCEGGMLFHGSSGLQHIALKVSDMGRVISKKFLGRGALLLGAGPSCAPLVWVNGQLALLGKRGAPKWRMEVKEAPFVQRLKEGFAVLSGPKSKSQLSVYRDDGSGIRSISLPVTGRITSARVQENDEGRVAAMGLCLDVTSPCSRPDGTRGPFNVLITSGKGSAFRVLIRHIQGHLDFASYPDGGLVIANSSKDDVTDLIKRDKKQRIEWQVSLPGRVSSGPHVGPSGEIYLATCKGWECAPPFRLYAVTGMAPSQAEPTSE